MVGLTGEARRSRCEGVREMTYRYLPTYIPTEEGARGNYLCSEQNPSLFLFYFSSIEFSRVVWTMYEP